MTQEEEELRWQKEYHKLTKGLKSVQDLNEKECPGIIVWLDRCIEGLEIKKSSPSLAAYNAGWDAKMEKQQLIKQKLINNELQSLLPLRNEIKTHYFNLDQIEALGTKKTVNHFNNFLIYYAFRYVGIRPGDGGDPLNNKKFATLLGLLNGKTFSDSENIYEKKMVSQWPNYLKPAAIVAIYEQLIETLVTVEWEDLAEIVKRDLETMVKRPK